MRLIRSMIGLSDTCPFRRTSERGGHAASCGAGMPADHGPVCRGGGDADSEIQRISGLLLIMRLRTVSSYCPRVVLASTGDVTMAP